MCLPTLCLDQQIVDSSSQSMLWKWLDQYGHHHLPFLAPPLPGGLDLTQRQNLPFWQADSVHCLHVHPDTCQTGLGGVLQSEINQQVFGLSYLHRLVASHKPVSKSSTHPTIAESPKIFKSSQSKLPLLSCASVYNEILTCLSFFNTTQNNSEILATQRQYNIRPTFNHNT